MNVIRRSLGIVMSLALLGMAWPLKSEETKNLEARRQELKKLLAEQWEYTMRENPEFATIIGDYRYNDRWSDGSLAHVEQARKEMERWLERFRGIDITGFPEQEKLNQELMVRNLKSQIESIDLKLHEMPVDQFYGAHLQLAQLVSSIPFNNPKQYEDYLARLHKIPGLMTDLIEILKLGAKDKLLPPKFLLEKTVEQCKSIAEPAGEANAFGQPVSRFPDGVPEADRKRLHDTILAAVDTEVRPAYTKLAKYLAADYAPKGRTDPGMWALPNGEALYRFRIRQQTTTNMDPEGIHQLGLSEVARIEADELVIAKKLGYDDLKKFRASLKTNPKLIPTSRQQIIDTYRRYIDQMQVQLPRLFGLLPKTAVEVRPTEEFREKESSSAEYNQGTPDGSRPGIIRVNTGDYQNRSLLSVESTAYHEGVPGHHMQISIAQTLPELPPFRQQGGYVAYEEGWALYSERLGKDIGFYQDPYSDFGRLSDEMLRAVRLVTDTGVHYKHWTRQQMVDYFHEHSTEDEPDVQSETDRYIAIPAQALAYKLGQLEILKLRQRAQSELGDKYDIRAFHDEILNGGALPLDVLETRVIMWIAAQKSGKAGAAN